MRTRWITATLAGSLALALAAGACGAPDDAARANPDGAAQGAADSVTATRAALPTLFSIMLGLQGDMSRVSRGLWLERYDSIAAAARAVADHPAIPPEEGQKIAGALGDDMARFQAFDQTVHDLAVRMAEAADARDLAGVLEADAALRDGRRAVGQDDPNRLRRREPVGQHPPAHRPHEEARPLGGLPDGLTHVTAAVRSQTVYAGQCRLLRVERRSDGRRKEERREENETCQDHGLHVYQGSVWHHQEAGAVIHVTGPWRTPAPASPRTSGAHSHGSWGNSAQRTAEAPRRGAPAEVCWVTRAEHHAGSSAGFDAA
ncbi:MAG: hypothetical protein R6U63_11000 [Longimicrobiales bacterium]